MRSGADVHVINSALYLADVGCDRIKPSPRIPDLRLIPADSRIKGVALDQFSYLLIDVIKAQVGGLS